jgi:hypothetical protein
MREMPALTPINVLLKRPFAAFLVDAVDDADVVPVFVPGEVVVCSPAVVACVAVGAVAGEPPTDVPLLGETTATDVREWM